MSVERPPEAEDGKQPKNGKQPLEGYENGNSPKLMEHPLTSVASGLAALFLEKQLKKGKGVDIPSLKIRIDAKGVSELPLEEQPEEPPEDK